MLDGIEKYMVFDYLPFGLNSAVHCVTKLFKPIIAYLQLQDIPLSIYIDDGLFYAHSLEMWNQHRAFIFDVIQKAGWTIAEDKSDEIDKGDTCKNYLGFQLDTARMIITLPSHKIHKVEQLIQTVLPAHKIKAKNLAKVLGNIAACLPSHGPISRVCTRSGYSDLAITDSKGWDIDILISNNTKKEFTFFMECLESMNGMPIQNNFTNVRVDSYFPDAKSKLDCIQKPKFESNALMVSDASDFKVACKWLEGGNNEVRSFNLSLEECLLGSGERELLAILKYLQHINCVSPHSMNAINFIWATDSKNLVAFLNKGSPKWYIQEKVIFNYLIIFSINPCLNFNNSC